MATIGIERREAIPQFISNFEVCENDSPLIDLDRAAASFYDTPGPKNGAIISVSPVSLNYNQ